MASILRSVADSPAGLTVSALSRSSGVPRATAHRLVAALERERLLGRAGTGASWCSARAWRAWLVLPAGP